MKPSGFSSMLPYVCNQLEVLALASMFSLSRPLKMMLFQGMLMHRRLSTDDNVRKAGVHLASICCYCKMEQETQNHLFWSCKRIQALWKLLSRNFNLSPLQFTWRSMCSLTNNRGSTIQRLWQHVVVEFLRNIWRSRNDYRFNDIGINGGVLVFRTLNMIQYAGSLITDPIYTQEDLLLVKKLHVDMYYGYKRNRKPHSDTADTLCQWITPDENILKMNTDGVASGSPGNSGIGVTFRDNSGAFMCTIAKGLGLDTAFNTEWEAVVYGLEFAIRKGWKAIWVEKESSHIWP